MKLLILAGGKGSRLRQEVPDVPKVLAPILGKPFIDYQIKNWISQGVTSFIFILHHDADMIQNHISSKYFELVKSGVIKFIVEPYPLDTGGAVSNAIKVLNTSEKFLVTNADTWLDTGMEVLWRSPTPSIAILKVPDVSRFGQIFFRENKVTSFKEKSNKSEEGYINAGIFLFHSSNFSSWTQDIFSLERDFLPSLVSDGSLNVVNLNTNFIDIGIPKDYNRFCRWISLNMKSKL